MLRLALTVTVRRSQCRQATALRSLSRRHYRSTVGRPSPWPGRHLLPRCVTPLATDRPWHPGGTMSTSSTSSQELPIECCVCSQKFPNFSTLKLHLGRRHAKAINQALMEDPVRTYIAIFGPKYKRLDDKELRYSDGLVITLHGEHRGQWYSFTQGIGGEPLRAIQHHMALPFEDAMQVAVNILGHSKDGTHNLVIQEQPEKTTESQSPKAIAEAKKKMNVETARNIWAASTELCGSLGEKYLVEQRRIPRHTLKHLAFRFLSYNETYMDELYGQVVSNPAVVVPVEDPKGTITGIQRIFLNEKTGHRESSLRYTKKSKGIIKGSIGVVQRGAQKKNGILYLVEGPETGASVAAAVGPDCTVLASMSVSLLSETVEQILAYSPVEVVLACDNDVSSAAITAARKAQRTLSDAMLKHGIHFRTVIPVLPLTKAEETKDVVSSSNTLHDGGLIEFMQELSSLSGKTGQSIDWNDVLVELGLDELRKQLGVIKN